MYFLFIIYSPLSLSLSLSLFLSLCLSSFLISSQIYNNLFPKVPEPKLPNPSHPTNSEANQVHRSLFTSPLLIARISEVLPKTHSRPTFQEENSILPYRSLVSTKCNGEQHFKQSQRIHITFSPPPPVWHLHLQTKILNC